MYLFVVKGVGCAKVGDTFQQVEGHTPFSGVWVAEYAQSICAANIAMKVSWCVRVTTCPDATMSCTQTSAVW